MLYLPNAKRCQALGASPSQSQVDVVVFNPAASGIVAYVRHLRFQASLASTPRLRHYTAAPANALSLFNKDLTGAVPACSFSWGTGIAGFEMGRINNPTPNEWHQVLFGEPYVLHEGKGIGIDGANASGMIVRVEAEWDEVPA